MSRRERSARERVSAAELAVAEIEATFGVEPADHVPAMRELLAARRGLWELVHGRVARRAR